MARLYAPQRWRLIYIGLALVISSHIAGAALLTPSIARAAGDPFFEYHSGVSALRNSENKMTLSGRFRLLETGYIGFHDTMCILDLTLSASPTEKADRWKIDSVQFANPTMDEGVCNVTSSSVKATNRSNQVVAHFVDGVNINKESYGIVVDKRSGDGTLPLARLFRNFNTPNEREVTFEANNDPISAFGDVTFIDERNPSNEYAYISNYDLKKEEVGNSEHTKQEVESWFDVNGNIEGLVVTLYDDKDQPPKVFVPKNKLNNAPGDLSFKLVAHSGEGALFIGNVDWLTFEGYLGNKKIENLYFLLSDEFDTNFYWSTNYDELKKGHIKSNGTTLLKSAQARNGDAMANSIDKLFTHIMNVPLNADGSVGGNNCGASYISGSKKLSITGPKKDPAVVSPQPDVNTTLDEPLKVDGANARGLNQNCVNLKENGWLQYWGVKDLFSSDPVTLEGCSIAGIVANDKGIGGIFSKLTQCMLQEIFIPLVQWATSLVENAAGISYKSGVSCLQATRKAA